MATEYGNPKFRDSNKNLQFIMNGQPATDALARVVNTVGANNIAISNTKFSSNSDYSKTHNNSVSYDTVINSTSKTYRIDWKLKSNVGTHPRKTTSLNYGLLSWFSGGTEGKVNNPVTYSSTKHQLKGTNNFSSSRSLAGLRYFDAKIKVNGLDGDNNKEVVFNTASSFAGDNKQIKSVAQGFYNYDAPYTVFTANSPVNWVSFQTANGGTSNEISITSSSGDISTGNNAHYLIVSDNSPSVEYGNISGKQTVHYTINKDASGNSISNTHAGTVTFTSDNDGKAFVTTNTDKTNSTSYPRNTTISYSLTDYNTSSSGISGKLSGSFSIYQSGGSIDPKDPELTYSWKITSGSEYVSKTEIVSTSVNAKQDNGKYQQYSYQNKYIINVKDNSGSIGSITGTPSISSISNPKPLYKIGTFNISGLSMTPAINTSDRNITVNTKVSGNYCTNFNVSNPSIDTTVTQTGSSWVPNPTVVGRLSITCENPQTDKIDQSNPASFTIKQTSSSNYASSLSNVILSEGNNEFSYRFGTISASSTNISVSGKIKVEESPNKTFGISGGSKSLISLYPDVALTFNPGYSKKVDDIRWKLKFTPDTTQNSKQITNVKSSEITVTQAGIPQGSEMSYNPLTISGESSEDWLTVTNSCVFNYNDYNNYTQANPNKMTLKADPNRTSVNEITVTDTNSSNVYKVQITNASVAGSRKAKITLSSSDSNTTLSNTISDFTQSGENINCNISLSYINSDDSDKGYVDLISSGLTISDTNEHNLSISRGTTGHTNNTLTGLNATKSGDNDSLTITTSDGSALWWSPNSSTSVGLNIDASGTNLGNYALSKSSIFVTIHGDSQQTPWVSWYSKAEGGSWTKISDEASKLTILQSGSVASATSSRPSLTARGTGYGLTNKPFKLTRGQPSSAATKVYYKVESSAGNAGTDDSVYIERTAGSTGFGQVSVTASSTNISIIADSSISVGSGDLQVPGSTQYTDWYVYGPSVTLGTPSITSEIGLSKITAKHVGASASGDKVPTNISVFAVTKDKEFNISVSVNPSVTATWEASVSAGGLTSSDSGTFDTSSYGSGNIYSSITYKWDTNETTNSITWKPDIHVAKADYEKSISCKVTVVYQDGTEASDTLTWKINVLKTSVKFEGTLKCSDDKTITAFDQQTYNTSAWVSGYKVTATSGSLTQDWTSTYKAVQNATSKTLTAVQGNNGSTTGDASFEYTLKSPDISNADVTTALDQKHTVHLYCYGKSYYNG